jgi:hypothetical protein
VWTLTNTSSSAYEYKNGMPTNGDGGCFVSGAPSYELHCFCFDSFFTL